MQILPQSSCMPFMTMQSFTSTVMEHVGSRAYLKPYQSCHIAASQPCVTVPPFHTGCARSTGPHQQRPRDLAVSAQAQSEGPTLPIQHHCPTSWNESRWFCLPDLYCCRTSLCCAFALLCYAVPCTKYHLGEKLGASMNDAFSIF